MNLDEIDNTISSLEKSETTFSNCERLAHLYVVREHLSNIDKVVSEYNDILPSYKKYCEVKAKFQRNEISESCVGKYMSRVCQEIYEFLLILYNNTDTQDERDNIKTMLYNIQNRFHS